MKRKNNEETKEKRKIMNKKKIKKEKMKRKRSWETIEHEELFKNYLRCRGAKMYFDST